MRLHTKKISIVLWSALTGYFTVCVFFFWGGVSSFAAGKLYVGPEVCKECHEDEYISFKKYAKKNHSYESILKMKAGLREEEFLECLVCHTTGYGRPGGFVSEEKTPHLKEVSCETCHGPGSVHAESEDPGDIIGKLSLSQCEECHNAQRVADFDYKPLIYGGAH